MGAVPRGVSELEFVPLPSVPEEELVALMSHPRVAAYLPLLSGGFTLEACRAFVHAKQTMWREHGYGPWAFRVGGELAGWGGLQPEQGDADFALVLHPRFWGRGREIFRRVLADAFGPMGLESITALLPPARPNIRAITRLGFTPDGEVTVGAQPFLRFRLSRP